MWGFLDKILDSNRQYEENRHLEEMARQEMFRSRFQPQTQWRDIDTAPKDGTHVIVSFFCNIRGPIIACAGFCELPKSDDIKPGEVYEGWGWVATGTDELHHPSHWMPLPEPPKEDK